ncbi:hypothetical protein G7046_g3359 [Stylonectria norvegica]|nr:hypothetical protein G7046_g3359 [Stylonectria norvegica]
MSSTNQSQRVEGLPFPEYFSALAANYAQSTGNSTRNAFAAVFDDIQALVPITKASVVHDNAAGPGTATSVLVDRLDQDDKLPQILITDNVPAMDAAARETFQAWPRITASLMDSVSLETIPDNHFTHSILNFSVFALADPLKGLQEIHRTLQPGGLAALLTWKRFGAGAVIHAAQKLIRPDLPPMKTPHPEFLDEGVLAKLAVEAGFSQSSLTVSQRAVMVGGAELEGLRGFMLGPMTRMARAGYTAEEEARWPDAIAQAVREEGEGGVRFEVWVVLARK